MGSELDYEGQEIERPAKGEMYPAGGTNCESTHRDFSRLWGGSGKAGSVAQKTGVCEGASEGSHPQGSRGKREAGQGRRTHQLIIRNYPVTKE